MIQILNKWKATSALGKKQPPNPNLSSWSFDILLWFASMISCVL